MESQQSREERAEKRAEEDEQVNHNRIFFVSWYEGGSGQVNTVQFVYNPAFDGPGEELLTQEECNLYIKICREVPIPQDWMNDKDVDRYRQEVRKRFKEQKDVATKTNDQEASSPQERKAEEETS